MNKTRKNRALMRISIPKKKFNKFQIYNLFWIFIKVLFNTEKSNFGVIFKRFLLIKFY